MAPTARLPGLGKLSMPAELSIPFLRAVACVPFLSGASSMRSGGEKGEASTRC